MQLAGSLRRDLLQAPGGNSIYACGRRSWPRGECLGSRLARLHCAKAKGHTAVHRVLHAMQLGLETLKWTRVGSLLFERESLRELHLVSLVTKRVVFAQ